MTITLTIIGEDAGHVLKELKGLSAGMLQTAREHGYRDAVLDAEAGVPLQTETAATAEKPAEPTKKTRAKKDAAPANISANPEDRKPPEDDAATQAQDEADEAAEVEAARPAAAPVTVEDVMGAVGVYVEKFGLPAAQSDGPTIFVSALGTPPNGEAFWKKSLLATATQDQLQKALVAWKTAAAAEQRFVAKGA